MSIWVYQDTTNGICDNEILHSKKCIFCHNIMIEKSRKKPLHIEGKCKYIQYVVVYIRICPVCGWWTAMKKNIIPEKFYECPIIWEYYGGIAVLKKLDLTDISLPLDDVSQYLVLRYKERFQIHPRLFEEVVAAAFRNMGYYVRVTAYQNDGGIDVILDGKDNQLIGIQVKRYRNSIKVSQIREFAGALIENDMTKGIFVTTSKFQSGAYKSASNYLERGIGIELMDSERLYDALQIKRVTKKLCDEIIEEIFDTNLELIYTTIGESMVERVADVVIDEIF